MARITALSFIVPVRDLDRAVAFYRDAFRLEEVFRDERDRLRRAARHR